MTKWWKDKVVYQIWPKSFYDGNGDGIGDLYGVIEKLDYLKELGIDMIWLSPVYASPLVDQGYDISDYKQINPLFGDMQTMDKLLLEMKKRDMKLIMDLVVNHCSSEHIWFQKACEDPEGKYGKYFYIRKKAQGRPSNVRAYFGGSVWDELPGQRCACYSADLLLRQYKRVRDQSAEHKFSYKDIKNVYTIVLYEHSPKEFHPYEEVYVHRAEQVVDSGVKIDLLQKYIFLPLDIFRKNHHNKPIKNKLEAWLTFFSAEDEREIVKLLRSYPEFLPLYEDLYKLCLNTKKVMGMFSKELQELDRNTVSYMIDEMQGEINQQKVELEKKNVALREKNITIQQKDAVLQAQKEDLKAKTAEINALKKQLAVLQREV